jgi:hypothetical protein
VKEKCKIRMFDDDYCSKNKGFIYPFGEILQKLPLNTFRGLNITESLSRIHELHNIKCKRISAIINNTPYHGIILAYIKKQIETNKLKLNKEN